MCLTCNSGEVEDETHFLVTCSAYNDIRNKYLSSEQGAAVPVDFVRCMMSNDNNILRNLALYIKALIKEAFSLRETNS